MRGVLAGVCLACAASVPFLVGVACSSSSPDAPADADASVQPGPVEAGAFDAGASITLDALPTILPDAQPAPPDDAGTPDAAPPDAGTSCAPPAAGDPCGVDPQCGCPSTQTCDFAGSTTGCVVSGNAPVGHACTVTEACQHGLTCFNGACRPYCSTGGDAGCATIDGGGPCVQIVDTDGGPIPGYDVCTFDCMLQDPNACGATGDLYAGCVQDGLGGTDCALVGIVGLGGDCSVSGCKPALVCVTSGASSTCSPWCRVGLSPSDCGDGEACQAFSTPQTANGIEYGFCP
jgi:hypothetical protein